MKYRRMDDRNCLFMKRSHKVPSTHKCHRLLSTRSLVVKGRWNHERVTLINTGLKPSVILQWPIYACGYCLLNVSRGSNIVTTVRMGKRCPLHLKLFCSANAFNCPAKQCSSSSVKQFLWNRLTFPNIHRIWSVIWIFVCLGFWFFQHPNFFCSSVISEVFIYYIQVLGKERASPFGC